MSIPETRNFDVSEIKRIIVKRYSGSLPFEVEVCPDCVGHEQMTIGEVNRLSREMDTEFDCKNLFLKDGKIVSQCCCYSKVHGIGYKEGE